MDKVLYRKVKKKNTRIKNGMLHITIPKGVMVGFLLFLKEVSYVHKGNIYLIKNK